MMKVTYITVDPFRYPRVKKIAYSLRKFPKVKFDILVPRIRLTRHGGFFRRVLNATINYLALILQIFWAKSDVFWVANSPDILVVPLILRRRRYILEYRSPWPLEVEREIGHKFFVRLAKFFERLALAHAMVITLTTSKLAARVEAFKKPFFVIPNYPLKNFEESISRRKFRRQLNVKDDDMVVLFVGRLSSHEGAGMLLKIAEAVLQKKPNVVFWIVGDGPFFHVLQKLSKEKKMANKFILFGWQPYESIPNFINAADVCILPMRESKYSGFYNEEGVQKISEYMFFGKPIVACGIAESKEYLLVDENAMADGILRALQGGVPKPKRRTWEEHSEKKIYEMFNLILSGGI